MKALGSSKVGPNPESSLIQSFLSKKLKSGPSISHVVLLHLNYLWSVDFFFNFMKTPLLLSNFISLCVTVQRSIS